MQISQPVITAPVYALTGEVKYSNVTESGYLELWSDFTDSSSYFSRGLDKKGLQKVIQGDSEWRDFALRFFRNSDGGYSPANSPVPEQLRLNIFIPGEGDVWFKNLSLININSDAEWAGLSGAWWGERHSVWLSVIMGVSLGLIGALIGFLASRSRASGFLLKAVTGGVMAGLIILLVGMYAILNNQPYHIFYPLCLVGIVSTVVFGINYFAVKRKLQNMELHKMKAIDS